MTCGMEAQDSLIWRAGTALSVHSCSPQWGEVRWAGAHLVARLLPVFRNLHWVYYVYPLLEVGWHRLGSASWD